MNSTIDRSHYPRSYNRMIIDTNSSQQNLINQTPMTTIPQTPENPYSYDSMPSNYRYVFSKYHLPNSEVKRTECFRKK